MGRKKIKITKIENDRQKTITFSRRRSGLVKKAHELSVLCDSKVLVVMFDSKDNCHVYSSESADGLAEKYLTKSFRSSNDPRLKNTEGAVANDYHVLAHGEGSEDLVVQGGRTVRPKTDQPDLKPEEGFQSSESQLPENSGLDPTSRPLFPMLHNPQATQFLSDIYSEHSTPFAVSQSVNKPKKGGMTMALPEMAPPDHYHQSILFPIAEITSKGKEKAQDYLQSIGNQPPVESGKDWIHPDYNPQQLPALLNINGMNMNNDSAEQLNMHYSTWTGF